jgi:hypothetical protein
MYAITTFSDCINDNIIPNFQYYLLTQLTSHVQPHHQKTYNATSIKNDTIFCFVHSYNKINF